MKHWKATKAGLKLSVKGRIGTIFCRRIGASWRLRTEEFWASQLESFRKMYAFCRTEVPYYASRPHLYPPLPAGQEKLTSILSCLPILPKDDVRKFNKDLWRKPLAPLTTFTTTSGTTGTPLRLPGSLLERAFAQAVFEDLCQRLCHTKRPRTLYLSGFMTPGPDSQELYWEDALRGDIYLSIYSMTVANRDRILRIVHSKRLQLVFGYASAMYELARLANDGSLRDPGRVCIATSEVLFPDWAAAIRENLGGEVHDLYGSQEHSHFVFSCRHGMMHIHPLVGIVEIVDDDGRPAREGEVGRVLVTGLVRRSMPLIRYELGDMAESTGYFASCECGLQWPTIGRVFGRAEDLVRTRDGRRVGLLLFHSTKDLRGIAEAQLVQQSYESFVFRIVRSVEEGVNWSDNEASMRLQVSRRLGYKPDVRFEYVPRIPRGPRGKFKAVVVDF